MSNDTLKEPMDTDDDANNAYQCDVCGRYFWENRLGRYETTIVSDSQAMNYALACEARHAEELKRIGIN